MKKIVSVFLVILLIFGVNKLIYAQKIEFKKKNEITIVYNPKKPAPPPGIPTRLKLEEDLTIGEEEGREEYMFTNIIFDVDNEGNIYVLDTKQCNVKIFDKRGKFLKMFGKKGQGPGEFTSPRGIQITPQKEIMICDLFARKLIFFSLKGEYLRQISTAKFLIFLLPQIDSKGNIIANILVRGKGVKSILIKSDSKLDQIFTIKTIKPSLPNAINLFPPRFYYSIIKNDKILWCISNKYEINISNPQGKLVKKILKEYKPVKFTDKDRKEKIKELFGSKGIPPGINVKFPKYFPPIMNLSVDEEGRIFVGTYEKVKNKKGYYFDVFDAEGRYLSKVPLNIKPKQWFKWKNKKLYVVEKSKGGFPLIKSYRVIWY